MEHECVNCGALLNKHQHDFCSLDCKLEFGSIVQEYAEMDYYDPAEETLSVERPFPPSRY